MGLIDDICNKIKEYEELNPRPRTITIHTGRAGYEMIMKAMNPEYTSTTCTTTMYVPRTTPRPYRHPCLLTQELILSSWKYKEDNGLRWWYTKENLFNESPCEGASYQILSATLRHDPELNHILLTVRRRGETEDEVMFDGKCPDYQTLILIENLTNVSGKQNPE